VQRRFTKRLPGLAGYNYSSRLALLDLDSLELRRLRQDLILAYKIVFRIVDVNLNDYFKMNTDSVTRGHGLKLFASNCRIDARKWFFSQRIINVWNSLPASAENFASLAMFNAFIINTDLSAYLQCKF
jgi:hypothetical protein